MADDVGATSTGIVRIPTQQLIEEQKQGLSDPEICCDGFVCSKPKSWRVQCKGEVWFCLVGRPWRYTPEVPFVSISFVPISEVHPLCWQRCSAQTVAAASGYLCSSSLVRPMFFKAARTTSLKHGQGDISTPED